MKVMIVGPGRMGLALAYALVQEEEVSEVVVCGRVPESPSHPIFMQGEAEYVYGLRRPAPGTSAVLLAVPDEALYEISAGLASAGPAPEGCAVFHMNGALSTDVLAPLHEQGYALGSFHPLQYVSHPVGSAERLRGCWVAVTGAPVALSAARAIVGALGGGVVEVPHTWKARAHAGFTLASSTIPALVAATTRILASAGVHPDEAVPATLSFMDGVLAGLRDRGPDRALEGPLAEGDLETASLHLRALDPEDRERYAWLGREVARISQEEGAGAAAAELEARFDSELTRP